MSSVPIISKGRGAFVLLAALALALMLVLPAGTMLVGQGSAMQIVLCTGQGPLLAAVDDAHPGDSHGPADQSAGDHPCAFAGHGAPLLAAVAPPAVLQPYTTAALPPAIVGRDQLPGRGLAAPPPPSHAPPAILV